MSVYFKRTPGTIFDLYHSLCTIYNKDFFSSWLSKYGMEINKDVEKSLQYLSKKVDVNKSFIKLFFHENSPLGLLIDDKRMLWSFSSVMDYVDYLKGLNTENICNVIISSIPELRENKEKSMEILKSTSKSIEFLNSLDIENDLKWILLDFFTQPLTIISEYINFLESYIPHLNHVLDKNKDILNKFDSYLEKNIAIEGVNFIKKASSSFYDLSEFEDSEEIYVTSMFFNYPSFMYLESEKALFYLIGFDFEKTINKLSGDTELEKNINIFKNLSDKTRIKILELIKTETLFGQEIAEKVGISMATVSYHMDYLLTSGLVSIERKGRKTYYVLNKDGFKKGIDFLSKKFDL